MIDRRYVAYYRVSTKKQGRSGLGLEGQQIAVRRYVENNPGEIVAELTEIESGRKNSRPVLREAFRLCRIYGAVILIGSLDRLARSVTLISGLMESRLEFVAVDYPAANVFTLHILAAVAEYESKIISERLKGAYAALKARGVTLSPHLKKFSAARTDSMVAARTAKLDIARRRAIALAPLLVELRDSGKSVEEIAREMMRMEIETPRGGPRWEPKSVRHLFALSGLDMPPATTRSSSRGTRTST